MRQNAAAFEVVLDYFVAPIVGMREFKRRIAQFQSYDLLFTPCDEAFIYLVLENNYDRWMDMFESSRKAAAEGNRLGKSPWEVKSLVKTRYTEGGQQRPQVDNGSDYGWQQSKGWTDAGIQRYNELFGLVKENRLRYRKTLEDWFARQKAEELSKSKETKTKGRDC